MKAVPVSPLVDYTTDWIGGRRASVSRGTKQTSLRTVATVNHCSCSASAIEVSCCIHRLRTSSTTRCVTPEGRLPRGSTGCNTLSQHWRYRTSTRIFLPVSLPEPSLVRWRLDILVRVSAATTAGAAQRRATAASSFLRREVRKWCA